MALGSCRAFSRWLALFAVVIASLVAPGGLAARAARSGNPVPPPKDGAWFGAYVQTDGAAEQTQSAILEREKALGRRFDVDHYYNNWNSDFPNWREEWDHASGRIPFISWAKASTTSVNAGKYDRQIAERAAGLKALGDPVLLEWFWEMDGARNRHIAKSPASFIDAWRRIHTIFRKEKADNVAFVWCPNAWGFATGEAPKWYPGDAYVDWICANGYNWAPGRRGDEWRSFEEIFQPFYEWASQKDKPLLIGEFGVQERRSGEKAQWMKDARNALKNRFPDIKAVTYFDSDRKHDWRVTTSRSAFDAYRAWARDDHFDLPGVPLKL
jgi:hypothetical protein